MKDILIGVALVVAVAAAYGATARHDFVNFDDPAYIYLNDHVTSGLTWANVAWAFTTRTEGNWHPLTWLSHMVDAQLFGVRENGHYRVNEQSYINAHHLVSVGLHAASAVLLFRLLRRMTAAVPARPSLGGGVLARQSSSGGVWPSAFVAALFALHPLHVESVAWVAERKDVLSTLLGLVTLLFYVRYARHPSVARYVPVFAFLALGLMAKPMLVTLPFVMLLLDYWPLGRFGYQAGEVRVPRRRSAVAEPALSGRADVAYPAGVAKKGTAGLPAFEAPGTAGGEFTGGNIPRRCRGLTWHTMGRLVLEKLPLFALVMASSIVTYIVQKQSGAMKFLEHLPFLTRLANALETCVAYLWSTVWPAGLAVFYPYVERPLWQGAAAGVLLAAVTALVVWQRRRRPYLAVGWFWYLGMLVPVIGLVQVGKQAMADRYTYLPLVGIFIAVAWGAADLLAGWRHRAKVLIPVAAAVLVACGIMTIRQANYWADSETIYRRAIDVAPHNALVHGNLGSELVIQGRYSEAVSQYLEALQLTPDDPPLLSNLGYALANLNRLDEAIVEYRKALGLDPDYKAAHNNLGLALFGQGKMAEAAYHYREVLRQSPDDVDAHLSLGGAYVSLGRLDEAVWECREAIRLNPNHPRAHNNLGSAYLGLNRIQEAFAEFTTAVRLDPAFPNAYLNLGLASEKLGRPADAVRCLEAALRLQPDWPDALARLARLRAMSADPAVRNGPQAVALAEKACAITRRQNPVCLDALAGAYAEVGRFPEAVRAAREALPLAQVRNRPELVQEIEAGLKCYEAGQPYRLGK